MKNKFPIQAFMFIASLGISLTPIVQANTIQAPTCSESDVQSAVTSAANGDTVTMTQGNCTWNQGVTIPSTKGLTIDGNGSTIAGGLQLQQNATTSSRVTNFKFSIDGSITTSGSKTSAPFRIDHNDFTASKSPTFIYTMGNGPGLIDHNTFNDPVNSEMIHNMGMGPTDATGWTDVVTPGSWNALYLEDNSFTNNDPTFGTANPAYFWGNSAVQSYYGARTVFRHNTLQMSHIDQHGTSGMIGSRWWEIYENTFNTTVPNASQCCFITVRAGSGVIFNNHHNGTNLNGNSIDLYEEDTGYPALYQVGRGQNQSTDPAYVWGNDAFFSVGSQTPDMVQVGRDYFVSQKPGYTPFTYPYPLDANGLPNPTGSAQSVPTPGTQWYVRPNGAGSKNGMDWNNAWDLGGINWSSVQPGHTVWISAGTYGSSLTLTKSGTSGNAINLWRATAGDAAATLAAGWNSAFDGQVIITGSPGINIPAASYVTVDGRTRFGIQIVQPALGGNGIFGAGSGNIDNITLSHIEVKGPYCTTSHPCTAGAYGINLPPATYTVSHININNCWVHGESEGLRASNWNNVIVERNVLEDFDNDGVDHEDVMYSYPGSNVTFRYNTIRNSPNDGIFFEFGGAQNFYFYGNLYIASDYEMLGTKSDSGQDVYGPIYVFNNVFQSNTPAATSHAAIGFGGLTAATVENNIFINVANAASNSHGTVVSDYNAYNYTQINGYQWNSSEPHSFTFTGSPFVNASAGDFHPTASSPFINKGIATNTSNNTNNRDLDGNLRGADGSWDVGAFEYATGGSPSPTPTPTPTPTPSSGSNGASSADVQFLTFKNSFNPPREKLILKLSSGASGVELGIFDFTGRKVRTLSASSANVTWDGRNDQGTLVASGTYFAMITQGGHSSKKTLVVVK